MSIPVQANYLVESNDTATESSAFNQLPHLQNVISQAITQFENTPRHEWSYRITRYENEEGDISSSEAVFDPSLAQTKQWLLLNVDGQKASPKQAKKFVKTKQKQTDESESNNISLKLRDIIHVTSLQLVSDSPKKMTASFTVTLSQLGDSATENLSGLLSFDKNRQFIETIEIHNTDTFSPMFSADISDFKLTLQFTKINNAILPLQHDLSMKGTFAFFTDIDEVSIDTFSDYRYVGADTNIRE